MKNDILKNPLYEPKDKPLMTLGELDLLMCSIQDHKDEIDVAVELGCYAGRTSVLLAHELQKCAVYYAVDNFAINRDSIRDKTIKLLSKFNNIKLIESATKDAAHKIEYEIDWLLVDADHQDHSIQQDCLMWLPKVRLGGIVAFHDFFNDAFPSVQYRVNQLTAGWEEYGKIDSLMIRRKP